MVTALWYCPSRVLHAGHPAARCCSISRTASGSSAPSAYRLRFSSSCSWSTWSPSREFPTFPPERLQAVPEFVHCQTDSRLDRPQGHMQALGDLHVRQSPVEGELDHLLLHRRQGLKGSPYQGMALVGRADVQGVHVPGDEVRGGRVG